MGFRFGRACNTGKTASCVASLRPTFPPSLQNKRAWLSTNSLILSKDAHRPRSQGPPIPVIRVNVVNVGIIAIRVRPIFVVAIAAAAAAAGQRCSLSPPACRTVPGACLVVSNATVTLTAAQSVANGGPDGNNGSAAIAMQ